MRIGTNTFRGELPHLAPEKLPAEGAQEATNCRMESGNLEAFRQFAVTKALANTGTVRTIYLHRDKWLSFEDQVDIARNVIEDDPAGLLLLTCPELYATPRYTTYALATTGAEPHPVATLPLGVPAPTDIPVLVLGVDETPTDFSIDILDEGDVLDTEWVTSPVRGGGGLFSQVVQDLTGGNPDECYRLQYDEVNGPGQGPYAYRNFSGISNATVIRARCDFKFVEDDDGQRRASLSVACTAEGIGYAVRVYNGNALNIFSQTSKEGWFGDGLIDTVACPLSHSVWYSFDVTITINKNGTQTVKATVFQGATEIATLTATNSATIGDYCGFTASSGADAVPRYATIFDNLHVQASGPTGIAPNLTATNYLYTFVNDQGWESAPSFPTEDILRPDGVKVTVTTSTTAPPGYSAVTLKRIYRLDSGTSGDLYLLVAEIALATADFVDDLTDSEIGPDILTSQDYDLPTPTLEGILALPNGIYAGFFGNQLCLSAAGQPHAWPVAQRYPCESAVTAICAIDNTIVVGTETVVYTCTGTEPAAYVMSKPGERQACVSKLSMVYLDGQGVAFASPDGYQVCRGSAGAVENMTEQVFTKLQWQAQVPDSIIAAVHDGVLHWYWETPPPAPPTETILFLFHFITDEEPSEGFEEYSTGADPPSLRFDQTDARWDSSNDTESLGSSSPAPKFGAYHISGGTGTDIVRRQDQPDFPSVPNEYSTAGVSTLQVSAWFYVDTGLVDAYTEHSIEIGNYLYPAPSTTVSLNLDGNGDFWNATVHYDGDISTNSNPFPIPTNEWVHLQLVLFADGTGGGLSLYVNGEFAEDVSETDLSQVLIDMGSINYMRFRMIGSGLYIDEAYGVLGAPDILDDFTPPVAPWPNPLWIL